MLMIQTHWRKENFYRCALDTYQMIYSPLNEMDQTVTVSFSTDSVRCPLSFFHLELKVILGLS